MNEKDRQVVTDSAEVLIDAAVSKIPGLDIAWGLSKALLGAGLKLRQQRALEWVEMVQQNPNVFLADLYVQEEFQDGFVFALEKYIAERSEKKRKYYRQIFLHFSKSEKRQDFELEKFYRTIQLLTPEDILVLPYVDAHTPNSYQPFDDARYLENVYNLINAGIIYLDPSTRWDSLGSPYVYTSNFGRRFIKYLRT
jgi:hypothetical protein